VRGVAGRALLLALLMITGCGPAAAPAKPAETPKPPAAASTTAPAAQPAASPAPAPAAAKPAAPAVDRAKLEGDAKGEGKLTWYTSADLPVAQAFAKLFEAKYGISVEVVRSGSEALFSRYLKEVGSKIHTPDVIHTTDESNFLELKEKDLLAPWTIADADKLDPRLKDKVSDTDAMFYTLRIAVTTFGYNTDLIPPGQGPKTWQEAIDPKYKGKIVHAHPGYSGLVLTAVAWMTEKFGWEYYESMAKLEPMIVQSALDVPKTIANGERALGHSGSDSVLWQRKVEGAPIEIVYPPEGVPPANSPQGVVKQAPHPNAARLFQDYSFSLEGQQLFVDKHGSLSARTDVIYPQGRLGLDKLNVGTVDIRKLMSMRKQIQDRFTDIFGV